MVATDCLGLLSEGGDHGSDVRYLGKNSTRGWVRANYVSHSLRPDSDAFDEWSKRSGEGENHATEGEKGNDLASTPAHDAAICS